MKIDIELFTEIDDKLNRLWIDKPGEEYEAIFNGLLLLCKDIARMETCKHEGLIQQICEILNIYEDEL